MAFDCTRNLYANARHVAIAAWEGRQRLSSPDVDIRCYRLSRADYDAVTDATNCHR